MYSDDDEMNDHTRIVDKVRIVTIKVELVVMITSKYNFLVVIHFVSFFRDNKFSAKGGLVKIYNISPHNSSRG